MNWIRSIWWGAAVIGLFGGNGFAGDPDRDRMLLNSVTARLFEESRSPDPRVAWPPQVLTDRDLGLNTKIDPTVSTRGDKTTIYLTISVGQDLMDQVVAGDPDRLAYVIGHELSHASLGHLDVNALAAMREVPARDARRQGDPAIKGAILDQQKEIEADMAGLQLALHAGYSYPKCLETMQKMIALGQDYTTFEGLKLDHPSWTDRRAKLEANQAPLWKAMSAFDNGAFFLRAEQYLPAESCFRKVTEQFPGSYDAWADLGHARLMQYCDGLSTEDVRGFGIGPIAAGGFYERPGTLQALVRRKDPTLWKSAFVALQRAVTIRPDSVPAQADLGLAHLVAYDGQDADRAKSYFEKAARDAGADATLSPRVKAAILLNSGAADLARNEPTGYQKIEEASRASADVGPGGAEPGPLRVARLYYRASKLAGSPAEPDRREAVGVFELYLRESSSASAWFPLALERYQALCRALEVRPRDRRELARPTRIRPVVSVGTDSTGVLVLARPLEIESLHLGRVLRIPVDGDDHIDEYRFPEHGIAVLATDWIWSIRLSGDRAPAVPLRNEAGSIVGELRPGMSVRTLEQVLGRPLTEGTSSHDTSDGYTMCFDLGFGVRTREDRVVEVLVAQMRRQSESRQSSSPGGE
jgi:tetratricopeptide (TPR) repeat protein